MFLRPRTRTREGDHPGDGQGRIDASDHARVRARAIPEEAVAAWRERVFGETMDDPVKVAVEEAVKDFGSAEGFTIWAWYANRIGVNSFLELFRGPKICSVKKS